MEGQPFFTTIAGLSVSLAGFGAVIAWLRDDPSGWDPVNLWRVKTIVRHALIIAFLCLALVPIHTFTQDATTTIRIGSALTVLFEIFDMWRFRHPDPAVWHPHLSWQVFVSTSSFLALLGIVNIAWASLGLLQALFLAPHLPRRDLHKLRQGDGCQSRVGRGDRSRGVSQFVAFRAPPSRVSAG